ncbi:hypothetical protein KPL70_014258 [Citrus sinensis]|nr:hypothetical protein KPL70_014258 [Citrus sinensis]
MSPYNLYKQKTSLTRSIRTLISTKRPLPKEYMQSSRLDQCARQASQSEQYVTMEIPSDLVTNWKREGYTHLHLGGVRLILTLHGRKGLPVIARIALLDTKFKEYQHAVIQLQGAERTPTSKIATLRHQIVYRLQNHALDLPTPYTTSNALMILADKDTIPTIIQIPKQIQKQDLLKLMPLEWLTNYEQFHQNSEPVQTTEATFVKRPNGQVKLSFQTPDTKPVSDSPRLSYTAMITAVQTGQEKKLPIHSFSSEGYPVYPDKLNGHFLWDVPEAHMCNLDCPCLEDTDIDEELEVMRRKKKKKKKSSYPPPPYKSFLPQPTPDPKPPIHPIRSCLMFSSHFYEESFPPLEKQTDTQTRVPSKPFVQYPITASAQPEEPNNSSDTSEPETNNSPSSSSYDSSKGSTDFESEYADITGILMATETADPSTSTSTPIVDDNPSDQASQTDPVLPPVHEHSTKPSSASWFTFDDIPHHKWATRLQEFTAWIDLQGTKPNAQPQAVLREFMARSTGSLRDWLESLGEYRQLQFMESPIGTALNIIHEQFIGEKTASTEADRKEYHQMKCCSLKRHLLDAHYKRMNILFYKLNGFNEPSLKHMAMLSLDKICEQKEFFKDLIEDKKPFSEACKKPYLKIECKDEKKCVCLTTKKRHFRKHFHRKTSSKKPFRYFKKKDASQFRKKKSNHCFICKKRSHFARSCPHKLAKAVRLIQHLQHSSLLSENEDVESNFSEQLAQDDQTAFLIAESCESSDSEDISVISTVQTVNHVSTILRPSLKISILSSKFHKRVPVIGFLDTGADTSMIDPSVLPSDYWERHSKLFRAVNGETFETTLITKKPIGIQFFPNCIIWKKIVASKLSDKDLLIGFDILHLVKNLFLTSFGVRYKQMFLPYTDTLRLYALSETSSPYSQIS